MRVNEYTSIDFAKSSLLSSAENLSSKFIERILLTLIAVIGVSGSLYVFSMTANGGSNPNYTNLSIVAASAVQADFEDIGKAKFKHFVKMKGKKEVGNTIDFEFLKDIHETRYVIEMGNGERVIVTANKFPYAYKKPGKYTLELKTITKGLISTIATKEIKIK